VGRINWGRVLIGGIVAGIVINVSEYVLNEIVLKSRWDAWIAASGRTPPDPGTAIPLWIVYGFLVAITAVWIYAAIRPRFGPGPGTAARAGFVTWILAYLLWAIANVNLRFMPSEIVTISTAWGLVEMLVATMLGAWSYREGPTMD
jgi:hypothetical protein